MNTSKKTEWITKAESLKPTLLTEEIHPSDRSSEDALKAGDSVIFDFGNHYVGHVTFHFSSAGSHPDAPAYLKIKFCENQKELDAKTEDYQGWISKGWIQQEEIHVDIFPAEVKLPRRYAFRYVQVEVIDASSKYSVVVDDLQAVVSSSADQQQLLPFKGNEIEQKLDAISLRTLHNCMQDVFEDGPKRDRRLWIGDLRLQALVNYESYQQNDLVKRCLYLFAGTTDSEGRVPACLFTEPEIEGDDTYMFDYSLFYIAALRDYCKATADIQSGIDLLSVALRQWRLSQEYFDENHLIRDSDELGWCFLDWNLNLNKQAGAQAVYIYCIKALGELIEMICQAADCDDKNTLSKLLDEITQDITSKTTAMKSCLYDEDEKLFFSGINRQYSYASQAWAVLAGVVENQEALELLNRIQQKPDAVKMVTPYMYHNFVEALILAGDCRQAYKCMIDYWGTMAADGGNTFYELFNPDNPDESPYGSPVVNSYCHAWSCTPAYFMRHYGLTEANIKVHP